MLARARSKDLLVQKLKEELLVYDLKSEVAHCLNPLTALIWEHADGKTSIAEMAALLSDKLNMQADERIVWEALDCLAKANLLEHQITVPEEAKGITRRDLIRQVAVAGGAAAVSSLGLVSIIAPKPAQAQPVPPPPTPQPPTAQPTPPPTFSPPPPAPTPQPTPA